MELQLLFDEERIISGPEESRKTDEERDGYTGGVITWSNNTFRRARLFKTELVIEKNRSTASIRVYRQLLYLLVEDTVKWEGEDPAGPRTSQHRRTYTTGPDSKRIRAAAAVVDGYGGELNA